MEVTEQCEVKISNRFASLENLDDNMDITRICRSIGENMKTSATQSLRR
jgi:hypothetical protein